MMATYHYAELKNDDNDEELLEGKILFLSKTYLQITLSCLVLARLFSLIMKLEEAQNASKVDKLPFKIISISSNSITLKEYSQKLIRFTKIYNFIFILIGNNFYQI